MAHGKCARYKINYDGPAGRRRYQLGRKLYAAAFEERVGAISRRAVTNDSISCCVPMLTRRKLGMEANRRPTMMLRPRNWSMKGWASEPISIMTKLACEGMNARESLASSAQSQRRVSLIRVRHEAT